MVFAGMLPKAETRKSTKVTKQINRLHKVGVTPAGWPHQQRCVFEPVRVFASIRCADCLLTPFRVVRGQRLFLGSCKSAMLVVLIYNDNVVIQKTGSAL
jgi:hypothetical protein